MLPYGFQATGKCLFKSFPKEAQLGIWTQDFCIQTGKPFQHTRGLPGESFGRLVKAQIAAPTTQRFWFIRTRVIFNMFPGDTSAVGQRIPPPSQWLPIRVIWGAFRYHWSRMWLWAVPKAQWVARWAARFRNFVHHSVTWELDSSAHRALASLGQKEELTVRCPGVTNLSQLQPFGFSPLPTSPVPSTLSSTILLKEEKQTSKNMYLDSVRNEKGPRKWERVSISPHRYVGPHLSKYILLSEFITYPHLVFCNWQVSPHRIRTFAPQFVCPRMYLAEQVPNKMFTASPPPRQKILPNLPTRRPENFLETIHASQFKISL